MNVVFMVSFLPFCFFIFIQVFFPIVLFDEKYETAVATADYPAFNHLGGQLHISLFLFLIIVDS